MGRPTRWSTRRSRSRRTESHPLDPNQALRGGLGLGFSKVAFAKPPRRAHHRVGAPSRPGAPLTEPDKCCSHPALRDDGCYPAVSRISTSPIPGPASSAPPGLRCTWRHHRRRGLPLQEPGLARHRSFLRCQTQKGALGSTHRPGLITSTQRNRVRSFQQEAGPPLPSVHRADRAVRDSRRMRAD